MHNAYIFFARIFRMTSTVSSLSTDESATDAVRNASNITLEPSSFEDVVNVSEPVRTTDRNFYDYNIYKTAIWMFFNNWKIVAPPGLLGNIVIVILTLRIKPFNSTSLFMISLAVVDLSVISSRIAMKAVLFDSTVICQTMWYIYNALPLFSNYILVFWTIERFIAVRFPLRVQVFCTVKRTAVTILVVGIFSFAVNIAWPVSIVKLSYASGCTIYKDKTTFIYQIWYKVDTCIFIFIPMITIFLCNIMIIYGLQHSTKRHLQMTSNEESIRKRNKEQRKTTITLLSVSFAFLILHVPIAIYNCMAMVANFLRDQEALATWNFVNYFGLTMAEVQNSINFYLYFLTGRRFRQVTFSFFVPCRTYSPPKKKGRPVPRKRPESTAVTH